MSVQFENEYVSVALPDGWLDRSDSEVIAFANPETHEELTISVQQLTQRVDATQLSDIVWQLVEIRAAALGRLSAGSFTVLDGTQSVARVPSIGTFAGLDSKNSIYSRITVTGYVSHVVCVSYYLHKCSAASTETTQRANAVVAMCQTKAH